MTRKKYLPRFKAGDFVLSRLGETIRVWHIKAVKRLNYLAGDVEPPGKLLFDDAYLTLAFSVLDDNPTIVVADKLLLAVEGYDPKLLAKIQKG